MRRDYANGPPGPLVADWTWPEAGSAPARTLLVPLGSLEQHGPHLPLDTDTRIASEIAHRAANHVPKAVGVTPAVSFGASGEHSDFPGTLSIGTDVLASMLIEIGRSCDAFAGVVFVNGHGGNADALAKATSTLQSEGRSATAWSWSLLNADAHAGYTETSMMLAICPEAVRIDLAEPGRIGPLTDLFDVMRRSGVRAVSPNGVLGDPTGATAEVGHGLLARCAGDLVEWLGNSSGS